MPRLRPPTRRVLLGGLGTAIASAPARHLQASTVGLAAAAARTGRIFGAAVRSGQLADPAIRQAILRDCAAVTPEIELKWDAVEPMRGRLSLAGVDDIVKFAAENGRTVRGHTLMWHRSTPAWAEQLLRGLIEPTHAEAGCLAYALHRGSDDPQRFVLVERWASREDLDAHGVADHMEASRAAAGGARTFHRRGATGTPVPA